MSGFFTFLAVVAVIAFIVGMVKPGFVVFWGKKKSRGPACLYLVAAIVFGIISGSISGNSSAPVSSSSSPASSTANVDTVSSKAEASSAAPVPASSAPALKPYSTEFVSGFYTAGVDFPAGTYDLAVVKGNGNVTTDDGSLNIIMGTQKDDMYQKEYKNAEFQDGTVLTLAGVSVKISSKDGVDTSSLKKRENSATKTYNFTSGNYVAGKDFDPGVYDLSLVKGSGNVVTDDGTLNAIMGTGEDMYQKEYKHVEFKKDVKLTISGATIKLVPSK